MITDFTEAVHASMPRSGSGLQPLKTDSDKLREAVFTTVRKVFLRFLVDREFIAPEEAAAFHDSLLNPKQAEAPSLVRNIEDPAVFLEVVRWMISDNPDRIVQLDQPYGEVKKPLGAWRIYNKVECFMMLEATFVKEFPKAAKALGNVDLTMFSHDWLHDYQDFLIAASLIRVTPGVRYLRFDLCENKARDKTHVIAIPRDLSIEANGEVIA